MQLKIITHLFGLAFLLASHVTHLSAYHGGCYECEEEVWEEVPCDDIPSNSTTIEPPYFTVYTTPRYTTTSTQAPDTTTTTEATTTTTTSTPTPPTTTPPPIETTTTTPQLIETTTITPQPIETTTVGDPYKKCYCECKVGCKEFCRKVVVNPEIKNQIVQVSKISEPVAQGHVELTHYHQRELVHKPAYGHPPAASASYEDSASHENSYTQHEAFKLRPYVPAPQPLLGSYRPEIPANKPPTQVSSIYNSVPKIAYHTGPLATPQVLANSYANAQVGFNNIVSDPLYAVKPQEHSYSLPKSNTYDFSIPFEGVYSKVEKSIYGPGGSSIEVSLSSPNSIPSPSHAEAQCQSSVSYSSRTPVKNSQVGTHAYLSNPASYEHSLDSYIREFLSDTNSPNFQPYESYSGPHYSLSFR